MRISFAVILQEGPETCYIYSCVPKPPRVPHAEMELAEMPAAPPRCQLIPMSPILIPPVRLDSDFTANLHLMVIA